MDASGAQGLRCGVARPFRIWDGESLRQSRCLHDPAQRDALQPRQDVTLEIAVARGPPPVAVHSRLRHRRDPLPIGARVVDPQRARSRSLGDAFRDTARRGLWRR